MVQRARVADLRWYAVATRRGRENYASTAFEAQGLQPFVPTRVERRLLSDRVKQKDVPIFPGYVFVRSLMTADARVRILKVKYTLDLVGRLRGDERIARHIPDAEIDSLRCMYTAKYMLDPVQQLTAGTAVVVTSGPLKGAQGVIASGVDGKRRLVVNIAMLGRGVRTLLSCDDVVRDLNTHNTTSTAGVRDLRRTGMIHRVPIVS